MQIIFMKKLKLMVSFLTRKLKQKEKIWQSLSTEKSSEYSKVKLKVGDSVTIISERELYNGKEGVILEIVDDFVNKIEVYRVEVNVDGDKWGYNHIQYFNETELDLSIQEKRDRRLKELGI